ncbi:MAG: BlaI/MecI/CopY family transcriptional regulator [candidate division Zixibacteria bacterium]|nr:BlaI/MecI/CopY family transcriptional regulator [candidate division Zixibacteria bacterium]
MTENNEGKDISITFKPSGSGLEKFFGKLEAQVIDIVWENAPITIKRVLYFLNTEQNHEYAYTTVMTVMNRLVNKNILKRTKKEHSFEYDALLSKEEFVKLAVESIITSLHKDYSTITAQSINSIFDTE